MSSDQALEVARRIAPPSGARVRFRADGSTVSADHPLTVWERLGIEVWDCWRADDGVRVHKITA